MQRSSAKLTQWKSDKASDNFSVVRNTKHFASIYGLLHGCNAQNINKPNTLQFVDGSNGFCCCAVINFVSSLAPIVKSFFHHSLRSLFNQKKKKKKLCFLAFISDSLFICLTVCVCVCVRCFFSLSVSIRLILACCLRNFYCIETKEAAQQLISVVALWLNGRMNETWFMKQTKNHCQ